MCDSPKKPSGSAVLSNWKSSKASFSHKVKMAVKNNFKKIKTAKNCCGNHGEVGC